MAKVHRSGTSLRDLDSIYDYVAESSPRNAEMLMRQFHDRFALLAANPEMGRPRPEFLEHFK